MGRSDRGKRGRLQAWRTDVLQLFPIFYRGVVDSYLDDITVTEVPNGERAPKESLQSTIRTFQCSEQLMVVGHSVWPRINVINLEAFEVTTDAE